VDQRRLELLWCGGGFSLAVLAGFGVARMSARITAAGARAVLTLVACVLSRVFGSSHGSQDDAFRRGRSMGYDAGWVEGRATARPVVVPLRRAVGRNHEFLEPGIDVDHSQVVLSDLSDSHVSGLDVCASAVSDFDVCHSVEVVELRAKPTNPLVWSPDAQYPVAQYPAVEWDRVVGWMLARRIPLLAGALSLALVGVVVVSAMGRPSGPAEASGLPSGSLLHRAVTSQGATPPLVGGPLGFGTSAAVVGKTVPPASAKAGISPVMPIVDAKGASLLGSTPLGLPGDPVGGFGVAVVASATVSSATVSSATAAPTTVPAIRYQTAVAPATVAPANPYQAAVAQPVTALLVERVVASPVVPLTAAEQTAADALAAANLTAANAATAASLTAANAKAAADLTAANALAAADLTAVNAAAAAAATAQAAADAAWAVANP